MSDPFFDDMCVWINLAKLVPELKRNGLLYGRNLNEYNLYPLHDIKSQRSFILSKVLNDNNVQNFINILLYTGHDYLAKCLTAKFLKADIIDMIDLTRCDPRYTIERREKFSFGDERKLVNLVVKNTTNSTTCVYPLITSPRGYCLLINNHFTAGTFKEMQLFRDIFYQLHFDVIMRKNLSKNEIIQDLKDIAKREELEKHSAFVFMIIAHGNAKNEIYDFDGEPINIRLLMDMLDQQNCPGLKNNPRIFFFNCCRGESNQVDPSSLSRADGVSDAKLVNIKYPDEFICYSTLHGFNAKVDFVSGTKFGEALADSFINLAWYKDLNQILTRTNSYLMKELDKSNKQAFEWSVSLSKELYFYPFQPELKPIIPIETNHSGNNNVTTI